jgi:site-specific recombinase XerD
LDFLRTVLPLKRHVFNLAAQHSDDAFALFDRWCGHQCRKALATEIAENETSSSPTDYPLVPLLTTPVQGQRDSGIAVVKALLLAGFALGRQETRLAVELGRARRAHWALIRPQRFAEQDSLELPIAVGVVAAYVDRKLKGGSSLPVSAKTWLISLRKWCELLEESLATAPPNRPPRLEVPGLAPPGLPIADDDGAPSIDDLIDPDDLSEPPDEPDMSDDEPDPEEPGEPAEPRRRAKPRRAEQRETAASGEARRLRTGFWNALENQRLPWTNLALCPDDAGILVAELKRALLGADQETRDAAGVVALVLTTGQTIDQALSLPFGDAVQASHLDGGCIMRQVPRQKGAWRPSPDVMPLLRPKAAHVALMLPIEVAAWLQTRVGHAGGETLGARLGVNAEVATENARKWLASLRAMSGGLQTLGRVERWLSNALYQVRQDHVPPFLLCALNDAIPCPAAYYRAYLATELAALHRETLSRAGWSMPVSVPASGGWVGTDLNPSPEAMKEMLRATRDRLGSIVQDAAAPLHVRHNAREAHEVLLLMLQTLHRAVSDPVESLSYLDLETGRCLIDDKRQGAARTHRVVPLTRLAVRQTHEHSEHVLRLAQDVRDTAPETAERLLAMLRHPERRIAPFRFFLTKDLKIVSIDRTRLSSELSETWRLPLNVARHFVSIFLLARAARDDALCSLLGHNDLGTQDLSIYSPLTFDDLFEDVGQLLDELPRELDLESIPTFLPALVEEPRHGRLPSLSPMLFGSEARAAKAAARAEAMRGEIESWIDEMLDGRSKRDLRQDDVDALFIRARESSSNLTQRAARDRDEALRAAILERTRGTEAHFDLPAIPVSLSDVSHICPHDCLENRRWLVEFGGKLQEFWASQFLNWKSAADDGDASNLQAILLTLLVSSLVLDPEAWADEGRMNDWLACHEDSAGKTWLRVKLERGLSRLYPVDRGLAEMISAVAPESIASVKKIEIVAFANRLGRSKRRIASFMELLGKVRAGVSADVPGLALGYADGSLGSVSVGLACLEREQGEPPTKASVRTLQAQHDRESDGAPEDEQSVSLPNGGKIVDSDVFRRLISKALLALRRPVDSADSQRARRIGPTKRFLHELGLSWVDLAGSASLAPVCALTAGWLRHLAEHGQRGGEPYAVKTILNYWYSWGLRVIEEFDALDPRELHAEELEDIYLQIVELADLENRQHLYPPMRNLHRYLVKHHGVAEIDWAELRGATQQGQRTTDANVVHMHEYLGALRLLEEDEDMSARVRALQSAALVLIFRFGLRVGECLGLREKDLYLDEASRRWRVRVRGNRFRRLKTDSSRRIVIQLEEIEPAEHAALSRWREHVNAFSEERRHVPLFSAGIGDKATELFPRQAIAMRLGQALRTATGDPSIRVHHCRHAYASRLLNLALGLATQSNAAGEGVRTELTSAAVPSRRVTWGVAAMMGHASPRTSLEIYAHCGHRLLEASWSPREFRPRDVDPAEWFAFACARRRKTMQRAFQRSNGEPSLAVARRLWSRVRLLGIGPKVELADKLQPPRLAGAPVGLVTIDRIIDHARQFGRVDGLAARLYISESSIERVLSAAAHFGRGKRRSTAPATQWWFDDPQTNYPAHEIRQIDQGLSALERLERSQLQALADLVERCLIPSSRMLSIESAEDLEIACRALKHLVENPQSIELLLPAKLPKRLTPEQRKERDVRYRRIAERLGRRTGTIKPRLEYSHGITFDEARKLRYVAARAGIRVDVLHGRVPGARLDRHDRLHGSARFGLRIHENNFDRIRSSKVMTRLLAIAAVAGRIVDL